MSEIDYAPGFELWKTNHGTDGWDAKTWLVAKFTTEEKAATYLQKRGFTFPVGNSFYNDDDKLRNTMGAISYEIRTVKIDVPVDPA